MFEKKTMVMIDIETMSVAVNACICSIGAVKFVVGEGITDTFYTTIDAKDCKRLGLDIDPATVKWWSKQNPEALKMLVKDTVPLKDGLTAFSKWVGPKFMKVWGNGSAFDLVIMREAYRAVEMREPWKYYDELCYRTVSNLFPGSAPEREGTYHNALDDATYQAKHLMMMLGE